MPDAALAKSLIDYAVNVHELDTPASILTHLHTVISHRGLNVLGAGRLPLRLGDWSAVERGKSIFLHRSVPDGWWDEYSMLSRQGFDAGLMMARVSLAPYTWTESSRQLEPLGVDRWPYELALKHGMRDGFTCPVGTRWVVAFWSRTVLSDSFDEQARALVYLASSFAAFRLQAIVPPDPKRVGNRAKITPRELSVLRLLSMGKRTREIAEHLSLGEETIRSHLKKAQAKLGVRDRTQAVAEGIRQQLIP